MVKRILVIPHIRIHNANALSSPYTVGFPAMTAWLGAVHALQRKLNENSVFSRIKFPKVGIISHHFDMKSFRDEKMYLNSLVGMAVPIGLDGKRAAFIEEARCSLDVTLVIEIDGLSPDIANEFLEKIESLVVGGMHIASGDVIGTKDPKIFVLENSEDFNKLKRFIMPGFVLVERRSLMKQAISEEGIDAMDALLGFLKVYYNTSIETPDVWEAKRKTIGWLVPIACGFQGISKFIESSFERDLHTPHRFAESIVTIGEFIMPYRLKNVDEMFWEYRYVADQALYACVNEKK